MHCQWQIDAAADCKISAGEPSVSPSIKDKYSYTIRAAHEVWGNNRSCHRRMFSKQHSLKSFKKNICVKATVVERCCHVFIRSEDDRELQRGNWKNDHASLLWYIVNQLLTVTMHYSIDAIEKFGNSTPRTYSLFYLVKLYLSLNEYSAQSGHSMKWKKDTIRCYVHHVHFNWPYWVECWFVTSTQSNRQFTAINLSLLNLIRTLAQSMWWLNIFTWNENYVFTQLLYCELNIYT